MLGAKKGKKMHLCCSRGNVLDLTESAPPKVFYMSQPPMLDLLPLQLQNGCCGNSWDKSEVSSSVCFRVGIPVFYYNGSNTKQQYLGVGL